MARVQHAHPPAAGVHGVEQVVVVHAGQGEQGMEVVPQQGIDGSLGGGQAWHGWSRGNVTGKVLTRNRAGLHIVRHAAAQGKSPA